MITLDDRTGSRDLYLPLIKEGVPVQLGRMEYGDLSWAGRGPEGIPQIVGVEYKTVEDVIKCIGDGRFAGHQLPGLLQTYNYVWLMVAGRVRSGQGGILQVSHISGRWFDAGFGGRQFRYSDYDHWLTTIELRGGVRVKRVGDGMEAAASLSAMYRWWTAKEWEDHRGHLGFDTTRDLESALLRKPSLLRRLAKELPGIGWTKSASVASQFSTTIDMVAASETEWANIPGIGKTMARKIRKELGWPEEG